MKDTCSRETARSAAQNGGGMHGDGIGCAIQVRRADNDDLAFIHRIRCEEVTHGLSYWEEEVPSLDDTRRWVKQHQEHGIVLIAEADSGDGVRLPFGWAALGQWSALSGYRHTREVSIYVDACARGAGVGRILLEALIAHARSLGVHTLLSLIESRNVASVRLHERCGFRVVGTARHMGRKFDQWLDLTFAQYVFE
ncbi:GNAT family N-acetyltransferase [Schaalia suimastitidis]|uniref:GNAT family N-acetyltransferase n=1 Tax=Schaalia suimastitidis TaxID=121163 RepID=UPI0006871A02|nr:GNAT family N-acetyltransferase [Schaalia suimastitidis]